MAEIYNGLRLIMAIKSCGQRVLYQTFLLGTPDKPKDKNLADYLENLPLTSTANYIKASKREKRFYNEEKELINTNPDGSKFDITLLYKIIRLACEKVAPLKNENGKWGSESTEMEYYVTAIKDMRNDVIHSQLAVTKTELSEKMLKLRKYLVGCVKTSGERYGRDEAVVNNEIKQVMDDLDQIQQTILGKEDIMKYYSDELKQLMIEKCSETLKMIFQRIVNINPVSFFTDDLRLEVDKIFVDVAVKQGKRRGESKAIDYRDLLKFLQNPNEPLSMSDVSQQQSSAARSQILLLEGVAGSGKTTLVTMVIQNWIKGGKGKIRGLNNYDLVLWVQCRDPTIDSYQALLDRLMLKVSLQFRNLMPRLTKLCKLLIVVDGLDEINENSKKLVNSLLHEFKNCTHTTFMCTSRPEKLEMFSNTIPREYKVTIAELRGIPKDRILEFVRRNHVAIKHQTRSERNTEELVKAVEKLKDLHEHLSLPMNLILLVIIWDRETDSLPRGTFTQTELYHKIHHLWQSKVLERLANHQRYSSISKDDLEDRIQVILKEIYRSALESLSCNQLILEEEIVHHLKLACKKVDLPPDEILSAFLTLKSTWTGKGFQERYSAPHKGIQDFYSALHIVTTLTCQLQSLSLPVSHNEPPTPLVSPLAHAALVPSSSTQDSPGIIREVLTQAIKTRKVDMAEYQNVLVHVAGMLHLTLDPVPEALAYEVVDLLRQSGMREEYQWLDLLENTTATSVTAKAVTPSINNTNDTIEISNNRVGSYAALLPHLKPSNVSICIEDDPADIPRLPELVAGLGRHQCLRLLLLHHYWRDHTTTSDDILRRVPPPSKLKEFVGVVSGDGVAALPPSLTELHLAVVSDAHALCLLPHLHHLVTSRLPHLHLLCVRVAEGVSPGVLEPLARPAAARVPPLPKKTGSLVDLELSGVDDAGVSRACAVASTLLPPGGYRTIKFPDATLTAAGCRSLIQGLVKCKGKVGWIRVPKALDLQPFQVCELEDLAHTCLNCGFIPYDDQKMKKRRCLRLP
ncbi:uncharacterized protein [Procambarus clarkii]|uniref:uncharacterized protein n=1 Tax=Procambarus clarkii TaxID=6728 RepID=UPI001E670EE2|nr:uncharacterized protein LOC123758038 [Procambarus clarkii]